MSRAYVIPDRVEPPQLPDGKKWLVLRLSMAILGRHTCKGGIPRKVRKVVVPKFLMVATDRKAARKEILAKLDSLFDAWDECERMDKAGG